MKKHIIKVVCACLALTMMIPLAASCNESGSDDQTTTTTETTTTPENKEDVMPEGG